MIGPHGSPHRALVVLTVLLAIAALSGEAAPSRSRVMALGSIDTVRWNAVCVCELARMKVYGIGETYVIANRPRVLEGAAHAVIVGRVTSRNSLTMIEADHVMVLEGVSAGAMGALQWLKTHPPAALVLLVLIAIFEWRLISIVASLTVGIVLAAGATFVLNTLAVRWTIGWPDSFWILALTTAVAMGASVADSAEPSLRAAPRDMAASLLTAVLFGDLGGIFAAVGGAAVPLLSKRVTLLFFLCAVGAAAFRLPDAYFRVAACCVFGLACADRGMSAAAAGESARLGTGTGSGDRVPFLRTRR